MKTIERIIEPLPTVPHHGRLTIALCMCPSSGNSIREHLIDFLNLLLSCLTNTSMFLSFFSRRRRLLFSICFITMLKSFGSLFLLFTGIVLKLFFLCRCKSIKYHIYSLDKCACPSRACRDGTIANDFHHRFELLRKVPFVEWCMLLTGDVS